jgi:tetratricopeptide (TPR) repeat protein
MKSPNYLKAIEKVNNLIADSKWQEALESLRIINLESPDTPAVLTAMGDCLIHLDKSEAAIPNFLRVTELEPASVEALNNLGVAYMFTRDFENAEKMYLKALQYKPDHEQTLKNLAFLYYQQDDRLGDAAKVLAGIIRLDPTDIEALFMMGKCYETGGDIDSATLCFERILVHQPGSPLALEALDQIRSSKK